MLRFVVKHTAQQLFTSLDRMAEYVRDNPNASRPFIVAGCLDAYHVSKESKELCDRLGIRVVCQCLIWDSLSTWSKLTYWPYLLYGKLNRVRHIDRRLHAFDPAALERLDEIANAAENCDDSIDDDDDDDDDLIDGAGDVAPRSPLSDFTLSPDSSVKSVNASPDAESSVSAKQTTTTRQQSPAHPNTGGGVSAASNFKRSNKADKTPTKPLPPISIPPERRTSPRKVASTSSGSTTPQRQRGTKRAHSADKATPSSSSSKATTSKRRRMPIAELDEDI